MTATSWPVSELSLIHRDALSRHFLALDHEGRRLRFGVAMSDTAVRAYIARTDFERDAIFGVFDEQLKVIGAAHVAYSVEHAELGVSVLRTDRNRGIGGALFARAVLRARNWGVPALLVHCLRENDAIMYVARKQGMRIRSDKAEADAWLNLRPADASTHFGEVFAQRAALFDYAVKSQLAGARRLLTATLSFSQARDD
jgi:GNAT superfamily N-acetyltransferase